MLSNRSEFIIIPCCVVIHQTPYSATQKPLMLTKSASDPIHYLNYEESNN